MKRLLIALLGVCPIVLLAQSGADFQKEFTTQPGKKLDVNLKTGGAITIVGWEKNMVAYKGYREGRDGEDCVLEAEETPSGVTIKSHYATSGRDKSGGVRLEVSVPSKYDVHVETMGGEVSIASVDGSFSGRTMGGALELSKLKGNLDLLTMGGPVTLKNSDVDGKVKTMGGQVLLDEVTGDVTASSMGGKVIQKHVRARSGDTKGSEVNISSMGGDIDVDDAPLGADVQTMGGEIRINSAGKFVKAKTMGGTIQIGAVDGWVDATTMGGNVRVTMTGDPSQGKRSVSLKSMSGDIELGVPDGLSMDIDVELTYTKGHEGDYTITSDFPLHQEVSPEWERDNGSPRKTITATAQVAGGKNPVHIKTINGNVTIKKM